MLNQITHSMEGSSHAAGMYCLLRMRNTVQSLGQNRCLWGALLSCYTFYLHC